MTVPKNFYSPKFYKPPYAINADKLVSAFETSSKQIEENHDDILFLHIDCDLASNYKFLVNFGLAEYGQKDCPNLMMFKFSESHLQQLAAEAAAQKELESSTDSSSLEDKPEANGPKPSKFNLNKFKMIKFRGDKGYDLFSAEGYNKFVNDVLENKVSIFRKSERVLASFVHPEDESRYISGENFEEFLFFEENVLAPGAPKIPMARPAVMVLFYVPWCKFCQHLLPIYESLFEKYSQDLKYGPHLIFTKSNAEYNEYLGLNTLNSYPEIRFFNNLFPEKKEKVDQYLLEKGENLEFGKKYTGRLEFEELEEFLLDNLEDVMQMKELLLKLDENETVENYEKEFVEKMIKQKNRGRDELWKIWNKL